ncbi:hypothetical protein CONLIGDRAFT_78930 [Coniochaeta ligniaria NRRL 30616]|uniref:Uncharacterized protein n=1 Tax=Coniochaeta ligniaria NRRL 30616 TaxID=1408157 RepID=A0A1J7IC73_9PEZI|nr:hypothetical protein CONLIGDRAFT_78930 [Coniochaeta ligniaria NRRL 30616]
MLLVCLEQVRWRLYLQRSSCRLLSMVTMGTSVHVSNENSRTARLMSRSSTFLSLRHLFRQAAFGIRLIGNLRKLSLFPGDTLFISSLSFDNDKPATTLHTALLGQQLRNSKHQCCALRRG